MLATTPLPPTRPLVDFDCQFILLSGILGFFLFYAVGQGGCSCVYLCQDCVPLGSVGSGQHQTPSSEGLAGEEDVCVCVCGCVLPRGRTVCVCVYDAQSPAWFSLCLECDEIGLKGLSHMI